MSSCALVGSAPSTLPCDDDKPAKSPTPTLSDRASQSTLTVLKDPRKSINVKLGGVAERTATTPSDARPFIHSPTMMVSTSTEYTMQNHLYMKLSPQVSNTRTAVFPLYEHDTETPSFPRPPLLAHDSSLSSKPNHKLGTASTMTTSGARALGGGLVGGLAPPHNAPLDSNRTLSSNKSITSNVTTHSNITNDSIDSSSRDSTFVGLHTDKLNLNTLRNPSNTSTGSALSGISDDGNLVMVDESEYNRDIFNNKSLTSSSYLSNSSDTTLDIFRSHTRPPSHIMAKIRAENGRLNVKDICSRKTCSSASSEEAETHQSKYVLDAEYSMSDGDLTEEEVARSILEDAAKERLQKSSKRRGVCPGMEKENRRNVTEIVDQIGNGML